MDQPHVLIIEDDPSVCELLYARMKKAGCRATVAQYGEEGLSLIETDPPDLLILDLQLPGMNGLDVCRAIRRDPWMSKLPVLMLTGKSDEEDVIVGLEVGADDYMTKPFSAKLLDARVKALLRRERSRADELIGPDSPTGSEKVPRLIIKTLGRCEIRQGGTAVHCSEQFSPAQRQLLAMLLVTPAGKLSQEAVQLAFWPDSSESRARSSLDSLLSRVRRTLEQSFPGIDSKLYLAVRRGTLSLEHVRVDAHEFQRLSRKGLAQFASGDLWQAEISFSSAFSMWQGTFLPGDFGNEAAADYQDELEQLYLRASQAFACLLARGGRLDEAIKIIDYARKYDMMNDDLVKLHYRLLLARNQAGKARGLLAAYRDLLHREKYTAGEINEILSQFPEALPGDDWLVSAISSASHRSEFA